MFELMQLRCFVAVAEELHFGRAAARMNMTQPPLSRQIQILERLLNVELVRRTSRSVSLTPAGKAFLVAARRIVDLAANAATIAQRAASGQTGSITLGFTAASGYSFVPYLVERLRADLPDVEFLLKEMVSVDQVEALLTQRIDVGLLRPPIRPAELRSMRVLSEDIVIAVPRRDASALPPPRRLGDFEGRATIMFSPEGARYFFDLLTGLFAAARVTPHYVQYVSQIHSILALVGAGLGIALVPAAARALHFDGVELLPLQGENVSAELLLSWRSDNENPALRRALDVLDDLEDGSIVR